MFEASISTMANVSTQNVTTTTLPSLDELLKQLGFQTWQIALSTFILPLVNLLGICLCSFSLWIFARASFADPIFFYYRLLCLVNIIHLLHNIPNGVLFTPLYFPWVNTYAIGVFQIYYSFVSSLLFHFEDTLRIGILLTKMKIFCSFVRKHFSASPQLVSLIFFLTCLCIDFPLLFTFTVKPLGEYSYVDSGEMKREATFYYLTSSEFNSTLLGKTIIGVTLFFLNLILTLITGITLNMCSYIKYKSHVRQRQREIEELKMSSINNRPTTSREVEQANQRENIEHLIERNMLYMALTLGVKSIVTRVVIIVWLVYFFVCYSFSNSLVLVVCLNIIFTLKPTVSIVVFYSFNKMFRDETNRKLGHGSG
jgi:hypothetical protein